MPFLFLPLTLVVGAGAAVRSVLVAAAVVG